MKAALIGLLAVAAVAIGIGAYLVFRPDGGGSTSEYAQQLDALCLDARRQVEALGQPSSTPMSKLYPGTVRIGRAFVKDAKKLQPPPGQAAAAKTFLEQRALYYDGLAYAYEYLAVQKNEVAFVRIVNGALANLGRAEAAAKALGAQQCTLRPFE
jgi:hypothetical protein